MRFRHRRFIAIALGAIALACGLEQRDLSPEAGSSSDPVRPAPNDGGATGVPGPSAGGAGSAGSAGRGPDVDPVVPAPSRDDAELGVGDAGSVACAPNAAACDGAVLSVCANGVWQVERECSGAQPVCDAQLGGCRCDERSCAAREVCSIAGRCEAVASDCPAPDAASVPDQDLAVVEVRFDGSGSAEVVIEDVGTGLLSLATEGTSLCNGAGRCVFLAEGASLTLLPGSTFTRTLPDTLPSGGELAIVTSDPFALFVFAYVAWGTGAAENSLEAQAIAAGRWTSGARVALEAGDTGFVLVGDPRVPESYLSCNP